MKILNNIKTYSVLQIVENKLLLNCDRYEKVKVKMIACFNVASSRLNIFSVSSGNFSRQLFGHVAGAPRSLQLLHEKTSYSYGLI